MSPDGFNFPVASDCWLLIIIWIFDCGWLGTILANLTEDISFCTDHSSPSLTTFTVVQMLSIFCSYNWWNSAVNCCSTLAFTDFDIFWSEKHLSWSKIMLVYYLVYRWSDQRDSVGKQAERFHIMVVLLPLRFHARLYRLHCCLHYLINYIFEHSALPVFQSIWG